MNWYLVKLVYQIICGDGMHTAQFDEQLRIIEATDEMHALAKAQLLGHREQETFYNNKEKLVQWKFIDVSEMNKIDSFFDGAELYSRIDEQDNAANYINMVQMKASYLLAQSSTTCLRKN
jgi:Domain of unknown function (DUF4288)